GAGARPVGEEGHQARPGRVRPARPPALAGQETGEPVAGHHCPRLVEGLARQAEAAAASLTAAWSTSTRRSISYLTCGRSRASKNADCWKSASATRSERGLSVRRSRRAASFGSVGFRPAIGVSPRRPILVERPPPTPTYLPSS